MTHKRKAVMPDPSSESSVRLSIIDVMVLVGSILVVLAFKATVLHLPYHWDEIAYINSAHWLAEEGLMHTFPGQHPPQAFWGHPPGLFIFIAALYRVFGYSIWISHLLIVCFAALGMFFTYRLTAMLTDRWTGILAALFLFVTPIYFAQSPMVLLDIPVAAVGVMCTCFALQRRWVAYGAAALLLVLLKETALAFVVPVLIYVLWVQKQDPPCRVRLVACVLPLLTMTLFFGLQKAATGHFVTNRYFEDHALFSLSPANVVISFVKVCGWIGGAQLRWAAAGIIVAALVFRFHVFWRKEFFLFLLIGGCFVSAFSVIYVLPRYLMPTLPLLFVVAACGIHSLFGKTRFRMLMGILVLALFTTGLNDSSVGRDSYSEDMQYVDVVQTQMEAAKYIEQHLPNRTVFARWPMSEALTKPILGSVQRPLKLVKHPSEAEIMVTTHVPTSAGRQLKQKEYVLLKGFERDGKFVHLYIRN
jgi:4-amino-4-deoxy-L-arabinose transferase-like glycosyltransferase